MDRYAVERSLADVILEEVEKQRYTRRAMQEATGIKARTWSNYFTSRTSAVPIEAVWAIGEVLGVAGSELMRRAEERVVNQRASMSALDPALGEFLTPAQRAELERIRVENYPEPPAAKKRRGRKAAG